MLNKITDELICDRRRVYLDSQKDCLLVEDATHKIFRNVKAFKTKDRPKAFDPMSCFPGKSGTEVAGELASYDIRSNPDTGNVITYEAQSKPMLRVSLPRERPRLPGLGS